MFFLRKFNVTARRVTPRLKLPRCYILKESFAYSQFPRQIVSTSKSLSVSRLSRFYPYVHEQHLKVYMSSTNTDTSVVYLLAISIYCSREIQTWQKILNINPSVLNRLRKINVSYGQQ